MNHIIASREGGRSKNLWGNFLGIFLEVFFGGFFGRNYLVKINKELMFLSRFWGNARRRILNP